MSARSLVKYQRSLGLILWVVFAFIITQILIALLFAAIQFVIPSISTINNAVLVTIFAALSYVAALVVATQAPRLFKRAKVTLRDIGADRLASWGDIGVGILALVPYFILSGVAIWLLSELWSGFDPNQKQSIPFENLSSGLEFMVAFLTLVIIAPIAEEFLFRGYLLGRLRQYMSVFLAVAASSLVFGTMHIVGEITSDGVTWQWAAALDTTVLGVVLALLRVWTGSIWASILLHMAKNFIAFYFLFINPITGIM